MNHLRSHTLITASPGTHAEREEAAHVTPSSQGRGRHLFVPQWLNSLERVFCVCREACLLEAVCDSGGATRRPSQQISPTPQKIFPACLIIVTVVKEDLTPQWWSSLQKFPQSPVHLQQGSLALSSQGAVCTNVQWQHLWWLSWRTDTWIILQVVSQPESRISDPFSVSSRCSSQASGQTFDTHRQSVEVATSHAGQLLLWCFRVV